MGDNNNHAPRRALRIAAYNGDLNALYTTRGAEVVGKTARFTQGLSAGTLFNGLCAIDEHGNLAFSSKMYVDDMVAVLAAMVWRIRRGYEGYVRDVTASIFTIAYLPFMAGFLMMTLAADNGSWRVVVFILLTISNDIGGYAAGVLFGKHPIAPQISPKKSWEGFAGSVILQSVVGALCWVLIFDAPWWQGVVTGLIMTITATAGDFAESAIKRDLGVKDMGSFLPGHGGMMDRFDSLIPNAFTSWALFTLFLGSGT